MEKDIAEHGGALGRFLFVMQCETILLRTIKGDAVATYSVIIWTYIWNWVGLYGKNEMIGLFVLKSK